MIKKLKAFFTWPVEILRLLRSIDKRLESIEHDLWDINSDRKL